MSDKKYDTTRIIRKKSITDDDLVERAALEHNGQHRLHRDYAELEHLVIDLLHRLDALETRLEAVRNTGRDSAISPDMLPILNAMPYDRTHPPAG